MSDRDCEKCKHHTEKGCDSWDCEFEQGMKRKEIIEMLKVLKEQALKSHNDTAIIDVKKDSFIYVMNVTINSLEIDERYELEYEQIEPCEDAISRQAVLDATVKINSIWNKITNSKGENLEEIILQLPPVNPQEPKTETWSIKDVADTFKKHGLIREQEPKTGQWILSSEKMPENQSIVACDAYNNKPWIPRGILITETENGKKKLYDAATYNGNLKAFLKGKELTSFSGNTFYLPPREIIAWMPLPKPYNPQEESEETE